MNNTDAAIEAYVLANLTAQITATGFNDNRIDVNEFDVEYTGGILTITIQKVVTSEWKIFLQLLEQPLYLNLMV